MTTYTKILSIINPPSLEVNRLGSGVSCSICYLSYKLLEARNQCIICETQACEQCCRFHCHIDKFVYGKVCDSCVGNIILNDEKISKLSSGLLSSTMWSRNDFIPSANYAIMIDISKLSIKVPDIVLSSLNSSDLRYFSYVIRCGPRILYHGSRVLINSKNFIEWSDIASVSIDVRNLWSKYITFEFYISSSLFVYGSQNTSNLIEWYKTFRISTIDIMPTFSHIIQRASASMKGPCYQKSRCGAVELNFEAIVKSIGSEVKSYRPEHLSIYIPGAVGWDLIFPKLKSPYVVPLIYLFPPNSTLFPDLFFVKSQAVYLYDNHVKEICESKYLSPIFEDPKVIGLKLSTAMTNDAFSTPAENKSYDRNVSNDVIPSNELLIYVIDSVKLVVSTCSSIHSSSFCPLEPSTMNQNNNHHSSGILILTTHRLIYLAESTKILTLSHYEIDSINVNHQSQCRDCCSANLALFTLGDSLQYTFLRLKDSYKQRHSESKDNHLKNKLKEVAAKFEEIYTLRDFRFVRDEVLILQDDDRLSWASPEIATLSTSKSSDVIINSVEKSLVKEFVRQGIQFRQRSWRISELNKNYHLCQSYPQSLVTPTSMKDDTLVEAAKSGRSRCRLPILTWMHPSGNALFRCSQPLGGVWDSANPSDEKLLLAIRATVAAIYLSTLTSDISYSPDTTSFQSSRIRSETLHSDDCCIVTTGENAITSNISLSSSPIIVDNFTILSRSSKPTSIVTPTRPLSTERKLSNASSNNYLRRMQNKNVILRICDARPLLNANINMLAGKGYENIHRLGGPTEASRIFLGAENIHVVSKAYKELRAACLHAQYVNFSNRFNSNTPDPQVCFQSFEWLQHVSELLRGAVYIALQLEIGDPVVVHCSDGWDRTSSICCLCQILLDPYYRTIQGFLDLVDKDFVAFGHQFQLRHDGKLNAYEGLSDTTINNNPTEDSSEISPVFLQFLDACWQILLQHPTSFQFNEYFLTFLAIQFRNGYIDNFKYNSLFERSTFLQQSAHAYREDIRTLVNANTQQFVNPTYTNQSSNPPSPSARPGSSHVRHTKIILPMWNVLSMEIWQSVHGLSNSIYRQQPTSHQIDHQTSNSSKRHSRDGYLGRVLHGKEREQTIRRESNRVSHLDAEIRSLLETLCLHDEIASRYPMEQRVQNNQRMGDELNILMGLGVYGENVDVGEMPALQDGWEILDNVGGIW